MRPLKVFYLDDEPDLLEIFQENFSSAEIEIHTFSVPSKAIEAMEKEMPDLIFLDYRLPGTTGDEVALKINENIPKALITGEMDVNTKAKYAALFKKPFELDEIAIFLKGFLTSRS